MNLWEKEIPYYDDSIDFTPQITAYPSTSKGAVVLFAGGGYEGRAVHEGPITAKWLNSIGITTFVVDYRVKPYKHPAEISDAMRAVRFVRANAKKYNIDKDKIAVMGFSAGGHLAGSVAVHYDKQMYEPTDKIDKESCRPDACILGYPVIDMLEYRHDGSRVNLLGERVSKEEKELMALQLHVTKDTPQTFLWHTSEDNAVPVQNTLLFAMALADAKVPFEVHIYPHGEHGLGLATLPDKINPHVAQWTDSLDKWFSLIEWK